MARRSGRWRATALRVGDWKLVGNDTPDAFQLFEIETDWKEENDPAAILPEKAQALERELITLWTAIEAEGPKEWWLGERNKPMRGATLNY